MHDIVINQKDGEATASKKTLSYSHNTLHSVPLSGKLVVTVKFVSKDCEKRKKVSVHGYD